jgi:equilibrative nucleoside transporter 1/2/3
MDKARRLLQRKPSYEPIAEASDRTRGTEDDFRKPQKEVSYSWIDYSIFVILGIAMLWAW